MKRVSQQKLLKELVEIEHSTGPTWTDIMPDERLWKD